MRDLESLVCDLQGEQEGIFLRVLPDSNESPSWRRTCHQPERLPSRSPCLYDSQNIKQIVDSAVAVPRRSALLLLVSSLDDEVGFRARHFGSTLYFLTGLVGTRLVTADD